MAKSRVLVGAATDALHEMAVDAAVLGAPSRADVARFYAVGVLALRVLDAAEGRDRRLGPAADANWAAFRGALGDADRLRFLLHAACFHSPATSPREVFRMHWRPVDEPWGIEFPSVSPGAAGRLLRGARRPVALDVDGVLGAAARTWGLAWTTDPELEAVAARMGAPTRVAVRGPAAIGAVVRRAMGRRDMDLGDQVTLVADAPGERQLFALGMGLTGSRSAMRAVLPSEAAAMARVDLRLGL
jgi:hypothetical protein